MFVFRFYTAPAYRKQQQIFDTQNSTRSNLMSCRGHIGILCNFAKKLNNLLNYKYILQIKSELEQEKGNVIAIKNELDAEKANINAVIIT